MAVSSPPHRWWRSLTATAFTAACIGAAGVPVATADPADSPTDVLGFIGTAAHCEGSAVAVAYGRTHDALVAICAGPDGQYQYRGVRRSDDNALMLTAEPTAAGGFRAENDGVVYLVSPAELVVTSGASTLYRAAWLQYRDPRTSVGD
jgi:hypothetical protein